MNVSPSSAKHNALTTEKRERSLECAFDLPSSTRVAKETTAGSYAAHLEDCVKNDEQPKPCSAIPAERQEALNNLAKQGALLGIHDANTLMDIEEFFRTYPPSILEESA